MAILSKVVAVVALIGSSQAVPTKRQSPDNTQPFGTNAIGTGFTVDFLGNQVSDNSCVHRDLGFAGHIGTSWFGLYGDNLWCAGGVSNPDQDTDGFHGMVRDSVSLLGSDPLKVHDLNLNNDSPVAHPSQLIPSNPAWGEDNTTGFGGTSIVEVDASQDLGAVYYLVNKNGDGLKGAGIASLQLASGSVTVKQRYGDNGYWWDANTTPHYGDVAAYQDEKGEYTYVIGNPPNSESGIAGSYHYQARVKSTDAFDLSKYEYWWGRAQGWKPDVLTEFTSETAVMWGAGQGQIVYSNHFNCYLYVHMGGGAVQIRTATAPEGPWSADQKIYEDTSIDGGFIYSGVAYPYLDTTGKTLTVAWTNQNHIRVAKITFN